MKKNIVELQITINKCDYDFYIEFDYKFLYYICKMKNIFNSLFYSKYLTQRVYHPFNNINQLYVFDYTEQKYINTNNYKYLCIKKYRKWIDILENDYHTYHTPIAQMLADIYQKFEQKITHYKFLPYAKYKIDESYNYIILFTIKISNKKNIYKKHFGNFIFIHCRFCNIDLNEYTLLCYSTYEFVHSFYFICIINELFNSHNEESINILYIFYNNKIINPTTHFEYPIKYNYKFPPKLSILYKYLKVNKLYKKQKIIHVLAYYYGIDHYLTSKIFNMI